jgi:hypothetical protein
MAAPKHAETFDETDFEAIPAAALFVICVVL